MHLYDYAGIEDGQDLSDRQQRTLVYSGSYYFFTVDRHYTTNGKMSTEEHKSELNKLSQYGTFIEDH
jgi:hypothetical protein